MSQATQQKVTGRAGSVKFNPPGQTGTAINYIIYIKKWSAEVDRKMADDTDSGNYDSASDLVWTSQEPVTGSVKGTLEGNVDLAIFQTVIVPAVATSQAPGVLTLGVNSSVIYGHGNADFSNLKNDSPIDDMVTFSLDFMSNKVFTFGA